MEIDIYDNLLLKDGRKVKAIRFDRSPESSAWTIQVRDYTSYMPARFAGYVGKTFWVRKEDIAQKLA